MGAHRRLVTALIAAHALCLFGAGGLRGQDRSLADVSRAPRFLYAEKAGLVALDVSRMPALSKRIAVSFDGVSMKEALATIARLSGLDLVYTNDVLLPDKRVVLKAEAITVAAALTDALFGADVDVVFNRNGRAALTRRAAGVLVGAPRQVGTLIGRVTERTAGVPVVSAQVMVVGAGLSRYTDEQGTFRFPNVPAGEHTVTVRRLGFEVMSRTIRVGDGETITVDFAMGRVATSLTEVVTTAAGERSRLEVGNTIGTIKADSLVPTTLIRNVSDLLTARTPGVIVSGSSGAVGAPSKIRIRGVNSIYLNNDPVIIIDGVRAFSTTTYNATSQTTVGAARMPTVVAVTGFGSGDGNIRAPSRLDDLDPNSIESIDVLRGPSAASLYGTEAANGVIVIKTKKGAAGPWRFNVLADQGASHIPGSLPDDWFGWGHQLDGTLIRNCRLFGLRDGSAPNVTDGSCVQDSVTHFNPQNDPRMSTLGTGTASNLSANLSGGTEQVREFLSVRYEDAVGIAKMSTLEQQRLTLMRGAVPPSWMLRPNTQNNLTGTSRTSLGVRKNFDLGLTASAVYRTVLNGSAGRPGGFSSSDPRGPWDTLRYLPSENNSAKQSSLIKRGIVSANANYVPLSWLTLTAALGGDYTLRTDDALLRSTDCTALLNPNGCSSGHTDNRMETFIATANIGAQASFAPASWLTLRTATGEQVNRTTFYGLAAGSNCNLAFGTDLVTPTPVCAASTTQQYQVAESRDASATAGFYVEQTAAFRERLFLTVGFRQDAASAFGSIVNRSLPTYPKFSASWLLSDESFFPRQSWVTNLRLRTAYGHSGNQARQTDILPTYQQTTVIINGVATPGIALAKLPNPELRPERTTEAEGGMDLSLFEGERLHVEFTTYRKLSRDAIMNVSVAPSVTPFSRSLVQTANVGSVENRGLEVAVTAKVIDTRPLGWQVTVNYSENTNKLVHKDKAFSGGTAFVEGYPVFGLWDYAISSYGDINGDGILGLNEVTRSSGASRGIGYDGFVFFGPEYPQSEVTLDNGLTFLQGALRLGAKVDGIYGMSRRFSTQGFMSYGVRCQYDRTCPLAEQASGVVAALSQSLQYSQRVSVIRLSELSATYTVSSTAAHRLLWAQSAAVTLAGRNLGVWTNYPLLDPNYDPSLSGGEILTSDNTYYPQPRNWAVRLTLGF